ncbi:hypothetical protein PAK_P30108 [Pseudomonas phage PAK_P3]|uniref:Uncharacterized protein n=2 Tax=Nankokuvirus PAKP3 TaxID=1925782 RepID=V5K3A2_9CAUD|nr:hypothetical protein PAK_P30108 [Pseudomonas phage PAK_P3]AGS81717.1 hypothetical protein P3_CHA0109 [Pseudomonas phage P3_CHA]AGS81836.1 hypothetical protein PAK_P30108 [Pseudomonas phage PAK_P3]
MAKLTAVREFNEHGYNWYPQVWVEALQLWCAVRWVRYQRPEGFVTAAAAIHFAEAGM